MRGETLSSGTKVSGTSVLASNELIVVRFVGRGGKDELSGMVFSVMPLVSKHRSWPSLFPGGVEPTRGDIWLTSRM